jgi:hypothetical protein
LNFFDFVGQTYHLMVWVALGFLLRRTDILRRGSGEMMATVLIYTTLPAAIFLSIVQVRVSLASAGFLILLAVGVPFVLYLAARQVVDRFQLERRTRGVFLASVTVSNLGFFLYPLFAAFYGLEALAHLAVYDIGNSITGNSFTYSLSASHGDSREEGVWTRLGKLLTLPPLWAGTLGLVFTLLDLSVPPAGERILAPLAQANVPLAMLVLGSFIELRLQHPGALGAVIGIKMGLGWALGWLAVTLLGLGGFERIAAGMAPAMPVGLVVLAYAAREGLDTEFAANVVSFSILTGMLVTPLMLALLS